MAKGQSAEKTVRDIQRKTRRRSTCRGVNAFDTSRPRRVCSGRHAQDPGRTAAPLIANQTSCVSRYFDLSSHTSR